MSTLTELQQFNTRSLAVVALIVIGVTGGNLWIHRGGPPVGYLRFQDYGLQFDFPDDMYLQTEGLGTLEPSEEAGTLTVARQGVIIDQAGVIWLSQDMASSPSEALDLIFTQATGSDQVIDRGDQRTSTMKGHDTVIEFFYIAEQGLTIPGIIGAWSCDENNRVVALYYLSLPDAESVGSQAEDLQPAWELQLNHVKCH
jgi:hypothetical protein